MKSYKFLLAALCFFLTFGTADACDQPRINISNCISSPIWKTWNSDYTKVKKICSNSPITQVEVYCSSGSFPLDKVVYKDQTAPGTFTFYPPNFSFQPILGHTYEVDIYSGGSLAFSVKFEVVDCSEFELIQGSVTNPSCFQRGVPIDFQLKHDIDDACYSYSWDFGDGTIITTTSPSATHSYNFPLSYPIANSCRYFTVTLKLDPYCWDCPCMNISRTILVCAVCAATYDPGDPVSLPFGIAVTPNPSNGPIIVTLSNDSDIPLTSYVVSDLQSGQMIIQEDLPAGIDYPFEFDLDLSSQQSGLYEISVISEMGDVVSTTIVLEN